jgi:threonine dehydratase
MSTIADGIATRAPIPEALEDLRSVLGDAVLFSVHRIIEGMRLLRQHAGWVVEPTTAVGVATLFEHPDRWQRQRLSSIICGSTLTDEQVQHWLWATGWRHANADMA